MADFSYLGSGKVYLRRIGAAEGLREVGNCSALSGSHQENVITLKDHTTPGGGTYNEVRRIDSVEISATLRDLSADNLARVVFGDATAIDTDPVANEEHTAYPLDFIPTNTPGTNITVTGLTAGTHYIVVPGGIQLLEAAPIDYMGEVIEISYTPKAGNVVEALLNSGAEFEIFFSGLNEARSDKEVTFRGYRWKPGQAQNLDLIGDEHASLVVTGKLLKDATKDGEAQSQFYKVAVVD